MLMDLMSSCINMQVILTMVDTGKNVTDENSLNAPN